MFKKKILFDTVFAELDFADYIFFTDIVLMLLSKSLLIISSSLILF